MTTSESSASVGLSASIATSVPTTVAMLPASDVAVEVTTPCTPEMSCVNRDWTSPERVRVKKDSGCPWRWVNRAVRSRCMIR